jgi:dimethylamine/trimethylamine dehydrogenase
VNTHEYRHVQKRLRKLDVQMVTAHNLMSFDGESARIACVYTGTERTLPCASVLTITSRLPNDELQRELEGRSSDWRDAGVETVTAIGDCLAPGLIAHAVYDGQRYAQELDAPHEGEVRFRRRVSEGTG